MILIVYSLVFCCFLHKCIFVSSCIWTVISSKGKSSRIIGCVINCNLNCKHQNHQHQQEFLWQLQRQKLKITTNHKNLEEKLLQTLKKKLKQELQAVLLLVTFIYVRENQILSFARVVQRGDCEILKIINDFILVLCTKRNLLNELRFFKDKYFDWILQKYCSFSTYLNLKIWM